MRSLSFFLGTSLALGLALAVSPARADIPPPGSCQQNMLGQQCEFAVDKNGNAAGSGVCVAEMCTRATPDGPMQYDCVMCRPVNDGTAGAGSGGEGGGEPVNPVGGAGGDPVKPSAGSGAGGNGSAGSHAGTAGTNGNGDSGGGCSVAPGARGAAVTLAGLGLALGLVLRRRRSSNRVRG